jgi:hypothetical protein
MALKSQMSQLALLGLVLNADDEGRGVAEPSILARELAFTPSDIETALLDLEAYELVQCYQVGKFRYYSLPRWLEWQNLRRPAVSKFPPPLAQTGQVVSNVANNSPHFSAHFGNFPQSADTYSVDGNILPQSADTHPVNENSSPQSASEGKGRRREQN